ncbi:MAG: DUF4349 domain-containing protein [Thaumarchaeota archaeon]|nr:DUF4349 domain-containing protein [Nitrososphaerota archaeon]
MDKLGGITVRRAMVGIIVVIVAGGILAGLASSLAPASAPYVSGATVPQKGLFGLTPFLNVLSGSGTGVNYGGYGTQVIGNTGTTLETTTTTSIGSAPLATTGNTTQGLPGGGGGLIEFSSQVTLQSPSPQQAASGVVALAYSSGGYVAYQSTYPSSANVVIRVPAADYQQLLAKVEALGTVQALTSNSNDVSVQYTDLNATLASLQTEQVALLRLLNSSASVNSTLAIESQLQGVNQQINEVESQILQTRTLIQYATIQVAITQTAQVAPLTMTLGATPRNGQAPLSVTFNAVVKGGAQPYVVNYNFGDGSASQGQIVIHYYYQPGEYNVTATVTDQNGTSAEQWVMVHVSAPPGKSGLATFFGTVSGLFVNVVEGIAEVAVVVLPIAAVGAAVVIPLKKRSRSQKAARQSQ